MADTKRGKLTTGEIVIVAAGGVGLLASFFPWYTGTLLGTSFHIGAWGTGLFPLATLVPILGTLMLVQVVVDKLTSVPLPARLGEFTWEQLHLVAAADAAVIVLCYLVRSREPATTFGFGFFVDLLTTIGLVVGAVLIRGERRRAGPAPLA